MKSVRSNVWQQAAERNEDGDRFPLEDESKHLYRSIGRCRLGRCHRDLAARTGRSILHELSDPEIEDLIAYIDERVSTVGPIVEKDRWTLWSAIA